MRMNPQVLSVAIFAVALASLADTAALSFRPAVESLRNAVYQDQPVEQIRSLYLAASNAIGQATLKEKDQFYWKSWIEYYMGRSERDRKNLELARQHLEKGLAYIDRALKSGDFSEGCTVKSELIGQMCLVQRELSHMFYLISNGPSVNRLAQEAIRLAPANGKAQIIIASSKIYPPAIYGGNPRKGIAMLKQVLEIPGLEPDDLFNVYSGIGIGYGKLGESATATNYLQKALAIFPSNKFVNAEAKKLSP